MLSESQVLREGIKEKILFPHRFLLFLIDTSQVVARMPVSVPGHLELRQPSLENPGWLTSLPARCPSAHVRHSWLSTSRMLNKLRSLPFVGSWASVTPPLWDSCFQGYRVQDESRCWIFTSSSPFQRLVKRAESNSEVDLHTLQSRLKRKTGGGVKNRILWWLFLCAFILWSTT